MNFFKSLMVDGTNLAEGGTQALDDAIATVQGVISAALGILTVGVIVIAVFIAYKFFTADTDDKRKNAKAQLIYAIIGVVVLLALLIFAPQLTTLIGTAMGN